MINLTGSYEVKADAKGRLMIPSDLKKQVQPILKEGFILKRNIFKKCLELFPMSEWHLETAKLNSLNRFNKDHNNFIRLFMAGVRVVEPDNTGRIQIPKDLVNYAGIKKNIVMTSSINRMEIWDKEAYEAELNVEMDSVADLAERVMGNNPLN